MSTKLTGRQRTLFVPAILLIIYGCYYCLIRIRVSSLSLSPGDQSLQSTHASATSAGFLPIEEAESLCSSYNLTTYPGRLSHRKIYDLVIVDTELDWLEIRLHELQHQVDYFVIVEATSTFTRNHKPLYVKNNLDRFQEFHPKIIYHALSLDVEPVKDWGPWEREAYTRNSLFDAVFPSLVGPATPEFGDIILVSDADEIPRPSILTVLRNCQFPERTTLRSRFFYYSFQWQHIGGNNLVDWEHPQATIYQGLDKTIRPEDLRMSRNGKAWDLWNAGWHCSSCFSTVAEMIHKIESFSHIEANQPEFKQPSEIVRRIRHGQDIFDRDWEPNMRVDSLNDMPEYVKENRQKFNYMVDRDPENANFRDYP